MTNQSKPSVIESDLLIICIIINLQNFVEILGKSKKLLIRFRLR